MSNNGSMTLMVVSLIVLSFAVFMLALNVRFIESNFQSEIERLEDEIDTVEYLDVRKTDDAIEELARWGIFPRAVTSIDHDRTIIEWGRVTGRDKK